MLKKILRNSPFLKVLHSKFLEPTIFALRAACFLHTRKAIDILILYPAEGEKIALFLCFFPKNYCSESDFGHVLTRFPRNNFFRALSSRVHVLPVQKKIQQKILESTILLKSGIGRDRSMMFQVLDRFDFKNFKWGFDRDFRFCRQVCFQQCPPSNLSETPCCKIVSKDVKNDS